MSNECIVGGLMKVLDRLLRMFCKVPSQVIYVPFSIIIVFILNFVHGDYIPYYVGIKYLFLGCGIVYYTFVTSDSTVAILSLLLIHLSL